MAKTVLVLAEDMYDDRELWYPAIRMKEEGHRVLFVGSGAKKRFTSKFGLPVEVDMDAEDVKEDFEFDALIIPGGYAPDRLRRYEPVLRLVRRAFEENKVVATICHGGSVLISAGVLKGRTMTCFMAIRDDIINAGANYVDVPVHRDGNLITSRSPADLHLFGKAIAEALEK